MPLLSVLLDVHGYRRSHRQGKNAERMETGQERNSCQESEPSFKRLGGRFRMDIILFTLTRHSDDYRKEESHIYPRKRTRDSSLRSE